MMPPHERSTLQTNARTMRNWPTEALQLTLMGTIVAQKWPNSVIDISLLERTFFLSLGLRIRLRSNSVYIVDSLARIASARLLYTSPHEGTPKFASIT